MQFLYNNMDQILGMGIPYPVYSSYEGKRFIFIVKQAWNIKNTGPVFAHEKRPAGEPLASSMRGV